MKCSVSLQLKVPPSLAPRIQNYHGRLSFRSMPIEKDLCISKWKLNMLKKNSFRKKQWACSSSSDVISFGVDNTLFTDAMRIMAENRNEFSDFNWGFATLGTLLKNGEYYFEALICTKVLFNRIFCFVIERFLEFLVQS